MIFHMSDEKSIQRKRKEESKAERDEMKTETHTKKNVEIESVIGLAVDGVLEACVKPEALTAGFKENGKGYGLESGLYFIF